MPSMVEGGFLMQQQQLHRVRKGGPSVRYLSRTEALGFTQQHPLLCPRASLELPVPQNVHVLMTELMLLIQDQLMRAKLICNFSVMPQAPKH